MRPDRGQEGVGVMKENPYPKDIFPDYKKKELKAIGKILREYGWSLDRLSGSWGRQVWDNCLEAVSEALQESKS